MRVARSLPCFILVLCLAGPSLAAGGLSFGVAQHVDEGTFEFLPGPEPVRTTTVFVHPLEPQDVSDDLHWVGFALADQAVLAMRNAQDVGFVLRTAEDAISALPDKGPVGGKLSAQWLPHETEALGAGHGSVTLGWQEPADLDMEATGTYTVEGGTLNATVEVRRGAAVVARCSVTGALTDIAPLGEELGTRIGSALHVRLPDGASTQTRVRPRNLEAASEYFLARQRLRPQAVARAAFVAYLSQADEERPLPPILDVYRREVSHLEGAVRLDPQFVAAYYAQAHAALIWSVLGAPDPGEEEPEETCGALRQLDAALAALAMAAELDPRSALPHRWGTNVLIAKVLARAMADRKEYSAASDVWQDVILCLAEAHRAVQLDADDPMARDALAVTYVFPTKMLTDGDAPDPRLLDAAIAESREAVRLGGDQYRTTLGSLLAERESYHEARAEFQKAVTANPKAVAAWRGIIYIYDYLGRTTEGLAVARKAVQANPDDASLRTDLGWFLLHSGDKAEAIKTFRKALELDPQDETARTQLEQLGGLDS